MKTKTFLKRLLSVTLGLCVLLTLTLTPTVSAEDSMIKVGSFNTDMRITWSSDEVRLIVLEPAESGFYTLSVTDHKLNGHGEVVLGDLAQEDYLALCSVRYEDVSCSPEVFYLQKGVTYVILPIYHNRHDVNRLQDGDMTIRVDKLPFEPTELPTGDLSTNSVTVNLPGNDEYFWFKYTPAQTGDYTLNFNDVHAFATVFSSKTWEMVYENIDTEYWDSESQEQLSRNGLLFSLEADTEYYICLKHYGGAVSRSFSMSKNPLDINEIKIVPPLKTFDSTNPTDEVDEYDFTYQITYVEPGSYYEDYQIVSAEQAKQRGIDLFVTCEYEKADHPIQDYVKAGRLPAQLFYNNKELRFYVDVLSLTDLCADQPAINLANNAGTLVYEDTEYHIATFRIRVEDTGIYDISSFSADFSEVLSGFMICMVDKQNNTVENAAPSFSRGQWALVGGQDYAFVVGYRFRDANPSSFQWYLKKDPRTTLFPDTHPDVWYYDAVSYCYGRRIITGYQNGNFGVSDGIDRQDFMVILARYADVDLSEYRNVHGLFSDVASGSYYEAAVNWAYDVGITTGYQDGRFGVSEKMTREQLVTFLYRFAEIQGVNVDFPRTGPSSWLSSKYIDCDLISDWSEDALTWAVFRGVIKGRSVAVGSNAMRIDPHGLAQRCEIAQIMYNIHLNEIL